MKSNIEYLKECIANEEWGNAEEWIDAIESDFDKLNDEIKNKDEKIRSLESEVSNLTDSPLLTKIDCGIGIIEYVEPDNLKLRCLMEDFKEKHSVSYAN